jgi:multiple sugar transport system substrate-binding protein
MLGSFNSIDKLADISSPPFQIPDGYRQELGEGLWNSHLSFDGQQLIAVPYKYHPLVLFYRADLLEAAGFPSDPIEVEAYLKQLNNWTTMVKEMNSRGIAMLEWPTDITNPITYGQFLFDRNLVFQGNTNSNRKAIDAMKSFRPYAANVSIWDKYGLELLQSGKLAMVIMPDWGEVTLASWLPEQYGKWRVTALPFGLRGIELNNTLSITVNEQSTHKHEAAKFLGHIMNHSGNMNWINGSLPSEFLGGQYAGLLYQRLIREQPAGVIPTPLDEMAFEIWRTSIWEGSTGEETLELVEQEISDVLGVKQRQLAKYLAKRGGSMDSQQ